MIRRLSAALLFIVAVLPLLGSHQRNPNNQVLTQTTAFAGESAMTPRCDCSQPGCICPAQPTNQISVAPPPSKQIDNSTVPSSERIPVGPLALALFLGLIVFARFGL